MSTIRIFRLDCISLSLFLMDVKSLLLLFFLLLLLLFAGLFKFDCYTRRISIFALFECHFLYFLKCTLKNTLLYRILLLPFPFAVPSNLIIPFYLLRVTFCCWCWYQPTNQATTIVAWAPCVIVGGVIFEWGIASMYCWSILRDIFEFSSIYYSRRRRLMAAAGLGHIFGIVLLVLSVAHCIITKLCRWCSGKRVTQNSHNNFQHVRKPDTFHGIMIQLVYTIIAIFPSNFKNSETSSEFI